MIIEKGRSFQVWGSVSRETGTQQHAKTASNSPVFQAWALPMVLSYSFESTHVSGEIIATASARDSSRAARLAASARRARAAILRKATSTTCFYAQHHNSITKAQQHSGCRCKLGQGKPVPFPTRNIENSQWWGGNETVCPHSKHCVQPRLLSFPCPLTPPRVPFMDLHVTFR